MMSILLTVAGLLLVSMLPGQESDLDKARRTTLTMQKIEAATMGFMAAYGRRPCPADGQYAVDTANFGVEAATPGTCTGGTPASSFGPDAGTGEVVGGTVPTKTLGLPDEYAFDGWGRRITYVVDKRATQQYVCSSLENWPTMTGKGGIAIKDGTGTVTGNVMAAYISHGPDGHGAFPMQGSSVANRMNTGTIDSDKLTNAGEDTSYAYSTSNFTNAKIQKDRTATFGDIVYYADYQKNTCCRGTTCKPLGWRMEGFTSWDGIGQCVRVGDFNGDGIPDILFGAGWETVIVFGKKTPIGSPVVESDGFGTGVWSVLGTAGTIILFNGSGGCPIAAGDVDHDGIDDILLSTPSNGNPYLLIFGHTGAWPTRIDLRSNASPGDGTTMVTIPQTSPNGSGHVWDAEIADINGDGYGDIIVNNMRNASDTSLTSAVYVVFGGPRPWPATIDLDTLNGANGFRLDGEAADDYFGTAFKAGDFNGDGVKDLAIATDSTSSSNSPADGHVYIVYGQKKGGTWASPWPYDHAAIGTLVNGTDAIKFTNKIFVQGSSNGLIGGEIGSTIMFGDINHDGKQDLLLAAQASWSGLGGEIIVIYGKSTAWPANTDIDSSLLDGTNGFYIWEGSSHFAPHIITGDVNGDGIDDIVTLFNNTDGVKVLYGGSTLPAGGAININDYMNGTQGFQITGTLPATVPSNSWWWWYHATVGLAALDFDADGKADIIVPAVNDPRLGVVTGSAYLIYGPTTGTWPATLNIDVLGQ